MLNPVFRRELITTFRSWKAYGAIIAYLLIMTLVALAFNAIQSQNMYYSGFDPQTSSYMYMTLGAFQVALVMLIVPAFSGGAVSNERERQTLDLLLISKMSFFQIVWGKLLSSLTIAFVMIIASLPVFSIVMYHGGVSFWYILATTLYTLMLAMLSGSVSVFYSAITKKTVISIVWVYLTTAAFTVGSLIIFAFFLATSLGYYGGDALSTILLSKILLIGNPGIGFMSLMDVIFGLGIENELVSQIDSYGLGRLLCAIPMCVYNTIFNASVIALAVRGAAKRVNRKFKNKASG